jgi:hypothetical protein
LRQIKCAAMVLQQIAHFALFQITAEALDAPAP